MARSGQKKRKGGSAKSARRREKRLTSQVDPPAKSERNKRRSPTGAPLWLLPLVLGVLLALPLAWIISGRPDNLPAPDLGDAEAEVRQKIDETRVQVLAAAKDPSVWGRYGMVLDAHGYDEDAATCYDEASRLAPSEHRWVHLLATVLEPRETLRALSLAKQAVELDPSYPASRVLLARLHEQLGESNEAKSQYALVLAEAGSAEALFGLGRLSYDQGDFQESLAYLEQARALQPKAAPVLSFLARLYHRIGQDNNSEIMLSQLEDSVPTLFHDDPLARLVAQESVSTLGYQQRAVEAVARGDLPTASGFYEKLTQTHPEDPEILFNFASLRENLGDVTGAEAAYRGVIELDPHHPRAHLQLGIQLIRQERLPEAQAVLEQGIALEDDEPNLLYTLGQVYVQLEDLGRAEDHFERVLDTTPGYGPAYLRLAEIAQMTGDLARARRHALRAQELGTSLTDTIAQLVQ